MEKFSILSWSKKEAIFAGLVITFILGISYYQLKIGEIKTRDAQRKSDVDLISRGLRKYYDEWGVYPLEATGEGKIAACGDKGYLPCEWGTGPMVDQTNTIYLNKIPRDPLGDKDFKYIYSTDEDRKHFRVWAALEYWADPGTKKNLTKQCAPEIQCKWYVEE